MPDERWKSIPGFPDYSASTLGRIRRETGGRGVRAGRVLVAQHQPNGYCGVNLYLAGVRTRRTIHTLVYETFVGPRSPGMELNHLDGDKDNNALSNLEACTGKQNKEHASRTRLSAFGARNKAAKLTDDQVTAIKASAAAGLSQRTLAAMFGVSQPHVSDIVNGRRRRS
jgi:hypothetical protein